MYSWQYWGALVVTEGGRKLGTAATCDPPRGASLLLDTVWEHGNMAPGWHPVTGAAPATSTPRSGQYYGPCHSPLSTFIILLFVWFWPFLVSPHNWVCAARASRQPTSHPAPVVNSFTTSYSSSSRMQQESKHQNSWVIVNFIVSSASSSCHFPESGTLTNTNGSSKKKLKRALHHSLLAASQYSHIPWRGPGVSIRGTREPGTVLQCCSASVWLFAPLYSSIIAELCWTGDRCSSPGTLLTAVQTPPADKSFNNYLYSHLFLVWLTNIVQLVQLSFILMLQLRVIAAVMNVTQWDISSSGPSPAQPSPARACWNVAGQQPDVHRTHATFVNPFPALIHNFVKIHN